MEIKELGTVPYSTGQARRGRGLFYSESYYEFSQIYNRPISDKNAPVKHMDNPSTAGFEPDWYGGLDLEGAHKLVREGWSEGAQRLKALSDKLKSKIPPAKTRKRRGAWVEEGDTLDVDRMLAHSETPWRGTTKALVQGPSDIAIAGFYGGMAHCSPEELFWRGAPAVALSDILEDLGYSVQISGVTINNSPAYGSEDGVLVRRVVLKDFHEPTRIDNVAAVLCNAGVYRTYGFRQILETPIRVSSGLGYDSDNPLKDFKWMENHGLLAKGTICLAASDERSAMRALEDSLMLIQGLQVTE